MADDRIEERDIVDRAFASAHATLNELVVATDTERVLAGCAGAIVDALEGLAHQVRDADDTVATLLVPKLVESLDDLGPQLTGTIGEVAQAIRERKR